jgi:hypothetical protein
MKTESIIKYHILINLIFGIVNFLFIFIWFLSGSFIGPILIITTIGTTIFLFYGLFSLAYYSAKRADFKLIMLSLINILGWLWSIAFPVDYHFFVILVMTFFYTLYLKWNILSPKKRSLKS